MPAADTARLVAELSLADNFSKGMKGVLGSLDKAESRFGSIGQKASAGVANFSKNAALIGVGVAGALATQVVAGVQSLQELETVLNATAGVIKSTGGAAGVSAQQVRDLAQSLEDTTTVDDKAVQAGENLLLTFTNIGKDVFPQAAKAATDLAVAMNNGKAEGADLSASAIQIGKALNDPIKGITALTRVGVSFTDQQKKQIKTLVESGKTVEAQKIILAELEREFGKAGEAAGTGFGADMRRVGDAVEGAQQALAKGFLPLIVKVSSVISKKLNDPTVLANISKLGSTLADALDSLLSAATKLPWGAIGDSLKIAGAGAKAVLDAFVALPSWVQTAVLTGWGLNKLTGGALSGIVGELGKGLIKGVLGIQAANVNIQAANVTTAGGVPGAAPGAAAGGSRVASLVTKVFIVGAAAGVIAEAFNASGLFDSRNRDTKGNIARTTNDPNQRIAHLIAAIKQLTPRAAGGDTFAQRQLAQVTAELAKLQGTAAAAVALAGDGAKLQNVANERLEAIKGFTQSSADATKAAQAAQVAATQQAAAASVHTSERNAAILSQKIEEGNRTARAAAVVASGDSRSERAGIAAAASQQAAAQSKTTTAAYQAANAIRAKKLSVNVNQTFKAVTNINAREVLGVQQTFKRFYWTAS